VGDEEPIGLLLVPPEARNARIAPVQDAGLARGRARWEQRHPAIECQLARRDQALQRRHVTAGQEVVQHRSAHPVDLDDDQSRRAVHLEPRLLLASVWADAAKASARIAPSWGLTFEPLEGLASRCEGI